MAKQPLHHRVVIDARMVGATVHGFARYVTLLADGLEHQSKLRRGLSYEPLFLVHEHHPESSFRGFKIQRARSRFLSPYELVEIPILLRQLGASAFHSPTFSSFMKLPCPHISTVHDLNHLTYGDWKEKVYYKLLLKRFALQAQALLTVSEFSRGELARWLEIEPDRIEVVYNAIDPSLAEKSSLPEDAQRLLNRYNLVAKRYFLCLSNTKPHKNLPFLMQAYQEHRKTSRSPWPLLVSVERFSEVPGVKATGALSGRDAAILLQNAGAVVFPSLYEGFGLPPVEAAVAGTPVVVSRIAPHQEGLVDLSPDEVAWASPTDRDEWIAALERAQSGKLRPPSPETRSKILHRFAVGGLGDHMDRIYRRVLGISS